MQVQSRSWRHLMALTHATQRRKTTKDRFSHAASRIDQLLFNQATEGKFFRPAIGDSFFVSLGPLHARGAHAWALSSSPSCKYHSAAHVPIPGCAG